MKLARAQIIFATFLLAHLLHGQSTAELEQRVRTLYDQGQWTAAAKLAAAAPDNSATLMLYEGLALARLNQLSEAASDLREAARVFPRDKRFPLELAGIAYQENNFGKAKALLHRALRLDSVDRYGNDFLGTLYLLDGNIPAALKYWNRIEKPFVASLRWEPEPLVNPALRERAFGFSPGQVLTLRQLRITQGNLARLQVVTDLRLDLMSLPNASSNAPEERYALTVHSVPMQQTLNGWLGRVLPMLRSLPYQGINIDVLNLEHKGVDITSLERWDPNKRRFNFDLSGPFRMRPRTEYHLFVDVRDERWNLQRTYFGSSAGLTNVLLRKVKAGASVQFGITTKLQWTLGGSAAYRQFRNAEPTSYFSDGWTVELRNRFDYLLFDWPDRRVEVNTWTELDTGRVLTAFPSRLIIAESGINTKWLPQARGDKYTVSFRAQSGAIYGNVPLDELFVLGMERDNSSDFWFRGISGDREGRKGNAPMGNNFALVQSDLDRKIVEMPFVRLDLGPFFDTGRAGTRAGVLGSQGWLYAAGLQAKIRTLGGVTFRLVYGRDLNNGRGAFYTAVSR